MKDIDWVKVNVEYDVWGYTDNRGIIDYGILLKLIDDSERLEGVKKVFNEMYHDYMNSKTTPLVSNYIPKFVHCLSEFTTDSDKEED